MCKKEVKVKSADNTKAKSLNSVIENWHIQKGIKLSSENVESTGKIDSYLLNIAMFL